MKLIPKAESKAAIDMLPNEMLEAAHGQKKRSGGAVPFVFRDDVDSVALDLQGRWGFDGPGR